MRNWSKRIMCGVAAVIGVTSITANIVQYQMYADLKDSHAEKIAEYSATMLEKDAELKDKDQIINELQKDLATEELIQKVLQEDLDEIMTATLDYSKELAAEAGFDPEEQDWIYGGKGHWYFFDYDF